MKGKCKYYFFGTKLTFLSFPEENSGVRVFRVCFQWSPSKEKRPESKARPKANCLLSVKIGKFLTNASFIHSPSYTIINGNTPS